MDAQPQRHLPVDTRRELRTAQQDRHRVLVVTIDAAARKAQVGDVLIIASYARMEFEEAKTFRPWVVFPDTATNRLVE